jgi:hypothetical protein
MQSSSINRTRVVEQLGTIAIVVGLFLVFFELRQSHQFARAELSAESGRLYSEIRGREIDPNFAILLWKSRKSPSELTEPERIQLNAYFSAVLALYFREKYNYDRGFFDNYEDYPSISAAYFFGEGYGKAYWESRRANYPGELVEVIDKYSQYQNARAGF